MKRAVAALCFAVLCLSATIASAHEFRPAVLTLIGLEDGRFSLRFQPPLDDKRAAIEAVTPRFSDACDVGLGVVDCHGRGLSEISIDGLSEYPVDVVVRVRWPDGRERHAVLRGRDDTLVLPDRMVGADAASVAGVYVALGVEHIVIGTDHVLFVLGLTALVGIRRRLLWTVTGFTVAHSITLALSALGGVSLPSRPVEVGIALSIALLAVELVDERPTLSRKAPGIVAFVFGLLHGMGFAGALSEIGLPPDRSVLALLGFNVGVELGQLAIVAVAAGVGWAWTRWSLPTARARVWAAYAGGTIAMAWAFERLFSVS
ncbi:MAG: HupE/UreJ family protein [Myxococcota bacterium]